MAEIHVQAKKSGATPSWLWIVVAVVILAAIAYFLMTKKKNEQNANKPNQTSLLPYNQTPKAFLVM